MTLFHTKAHAERQAVNTTVQGSAADLAKTAMIVVEKAIYKTFPQTLCAVGKEFTLNAPRLVLHLHDELMYEVSKTQKDTLIIFFLVQCLVFIQ